MDDGQISSTEPSKKLIASLSKHTKIEMEDVKKRYQEMLDHKNEKIKKLEKKNQEYLNIICETGPTIQ